MPSELCDADTLIAMQIGDQLIVRAGRARGQPGDILFFQPRQIVRGVPEFSLLLDRVLAAPGSAPSGGFAFKASRVDAPVRHIRVFTKSGEHLLLVEHSSGIQGGGTHLELPSVNATASIKDAITAMRADNCSAIVVSYSPGEHELFFNYDIARARAAMLTLADLKGLGHFVSVSKAIPSSRGHLFSMAAAVHPGTVNITTMFEEVGGAVTNAVKICLCSTDDDAHTVFDETPSLNGKPCNKGYPGHGTYQCF